MNVCKFASSRSDALKAGAWLHEKKSQICVFPLVFFVFVFFYYLVNFVKRWKSFRS